jgi:hypothetical protein
MAEIRKPRGIIRTLDPSDPRNPNHPSHDEQWLELAGALGRAMADRDFDRLYGKQGAKENGKIKSSHLRKILK